MKLYLQCAWNTIDFIKFVRNFVNYSSTAIFDILIDLNVLSLFLFDRRSVQENYRNEKNRYLNHSSPNKMVSTEYYDPNQNKYHKVDGYNLATSQSNSSSATNINNGTGNNTQSQIHSYLHHHQLQQHSNEFSANNNNNSNGNMIGFSSAVLHPALLNIMNEAQGMKFRGNHVYKNTIVLTVFNIRSFFHIFSDRSFSDIQQKPRLHHQQQQPNNNSSSPRRRQFLAAQTRI